MDQCSLSRTCSECLSTGDALCGWCILRSSCVRLTNCEPVTDNVGEQQIVFENSVARCPAITSATPSVVHLEQLQTVSNGSIVCHISRSQLYVGLLYQAAFKRHTCIRIGCGYRRGKLSYGHPLIQTCIDVLCTYVCIILKTCGAKVTMLVIIISNSKVDCNSSIIYISVQKSSPRLLSRECMYGLPLKHELCYLCSGQSINGLSLRYIC